LQTRCSLGPAAKLGVGITNDITRKVEQRFQVNWEKVEKEIRQIPLTLEEISQLRRKNFTPTARARSGPRRSRVRGELSALSELAAIGFRQRFEKIGDREYRMR